MGESLIQGVLRVQQDGTVSIGSCDGVVLRDGLLSDVSTLDRKQVRVTSSVTNEYHGKQVTVILGLEEANDDEPMAKRTKTEERLDAINIRCGHADTAPIPIADRPTLITNSTPIADHPTPVTNPTPIADLRPDPNICFQGKVTQKSERRPFKNGNGELLTIEVEDQSARIRCTAFNSSCARVDAIVNIGDYYLFEKGTLKDANKKFNNSGHDFEFTISDRTRIEEVKKDETYEKIDAMSPGNVYTTRGIVLLCGDLMEYTRNERVNKRRSIVIADADESCIEITVFGHSMMLDVGTYVKISMLKVNTWQEKTTGTVSNANAISCIHVPDENTRWFVDIYDNHRHRYEELVQPWTRSNVCKSERSL